MKKYLLLMLVISGSSHILASANINNDIEYRNIFNCSITTLNTLESYLLSELSTPELDYEKLLDKQLSTMRDIDRLALIIPTLSKRSSKKALEELSILELELNSIDTQMAMYPRYITDTIYRAEQEQKEKNKFFKIFQAKVETIVQSKLASMDTVIMADTTHTELEIQIYHPSSEHYAWNDYENNDINLIFSSAQAKPFFAVLFSVQEEPITENLPIGGKILKQRLKNGTIAYFLVAFKTMQDAQIARDRLAKQEEYEESYVVLLKK